MKTSSWNCSWMFPSILAGLAVIAVGCTESTTERDVADAREGLREEQQESAETVQDAQRDVAKAQREAQPYTVNKPVTSDEAAEARQDIAEARQEGNEAIRDQQQEEGEAAAEVRTAEQELATTKARDQFVMEAEKHLADVGARIDNLKSQASAAEGAAKENLDRQIDAMESQHDRVEEALGSLKSAELSQWEAHRQQVRTAMQQLDNSLTNLR